MEPRNDRSGRSLVPKPPMTKVDELWVHSGTPEPGANWERILEDVREERMESVLKA